MSVLMSNIVEKIFFKIVFPELCKNCECEVDLINASNGGLNVLNCCGI